MHPIKCIGRELTTSITAVMSYLQLQNNQQIDTGGFKITHYIYIIGLYILLYTVVWLVLPPLALVRRQAAIADFVPHYSHREIHALSYLEIVLSRVSLVQCYTQTRIHCPSTCRFNLAARDQQPRPRLQFREIHSSSCLRKPHSLFSFLM